MTDCKECIYCMDTIRTVNRCEKTGKDSMRTWTENVRMDICTLNLRMTRPECPLFDDGKEVRE